MGACSVLSGLSDVVWCGVVWCGVVWCGVVWWYNRFSGWWSCSTPGNPSIRQQCNVTSTLGSQAVINTGLAPGINTQHSTVDDV